MDRTYVTQQHKTPVFQLGLDLWRDHVVHNATIQQARGCSMSGFFSGGSCRQFLLQSYKRVGLASRCRHSELAC